MGTYNVDDLNEKTVRNLKEGVASAKKKYGSHLYR